MRAIYIARTRLYKYTKGSNMHIVCCMEIILQPAVICRLIRV